jgi:hypothetical protein
MITEDRLAQWASPPSESEQTKADNAERVIREALTSADSLRGVSFDVFTQGSYKANTNTRLNSDVDICVRATDTFFYDLGPVKLTQLDLPPATLQYTSFRSMVETALVDRFGRGGVTRGNKAFDVHANTYRLDADVVVAFGHRRYFMGANNSPLYHEGIKFFPDKGQGIENWPDQTHRNGVDKNTRTGRRCKAAIRILKRLRDQMQADGIVAANDIGSFLIESLVWNVPDDGFTSGTYRALTQNVLAFLFNQTRDDVSCLEWGEVNELKYIFRGSSGLRARVHSFISAAWDFVGLS